MRMTKCGWENADGKISFEILYIFFKTKNIVKQSLFVFVSLLRKGGWQAYTTLNPRFCYAVLFRSLSNDFVACGFVVYITCF